VGRSCTACAHPDRRKIDKALVDGVSERTIAGRYGLTKSTVHRHATGHIPALLTKAHAVEVVASADDLLGQVTALKIRALGLLTTAEKANDTRAAILACREVRECVSLLAELAGKIDKAPKINVLVMPEWTSLRETILRALVPYPEARLTLSRALDGVPTDAHH
jgi:hypothetical protein